MPQDQNPEDVMIWVDGEPGGEKRYDAGVVLSTVIDPQQRNEDDARELVKDFVKKLAMHVPVAVETQSSLIVLVEQYIPHGVEAAANEEKADNANLWPPQRFEVISKEIFE